MKDEAALTAELKPKVDALKVKIEAARKKALEKPALEGVPGGLVVEANCAPPTGMPFANNATFMLQDEGFCEETFDQHKGSQLFRFASVSEFCAEALYRTGPAPRPTFGEFTTAAQIKKNWEAAVARRQTAVTLRYVVFVEPLEQVRPVAGGDTFKAGLWRGAFRVFDLETGKRGSRLIHAETLLQKLTGAESALVVNNCASAVLLTLSALANKKRVVIARSQLVETGGGFRVPDVMKQSGAKLVEVGTTNKIRLSDYRSAFEEPTALVMQAHRSNFKIVGFTEEPELKDLVEAANEHHIPVIHDLGSGAFYDTAKFGFSHEPTVQESMKAGADVILFSGDKLLGGPQAGIIIGKKELLDRIKKHPLARAVRADKACLAGLSATFTHYLRDEAERAIPILRMMSLTLEQVKGRAEAWKAELGQGVVVSGESTVGGGSLPDESIPTYLLELQVKSVEKKLRDMRKNNPPIIARTENDRILLDPRTVLPEQEGALLVGLKNILKV